MSLGWILVWIVVLGVATWFANAFLVSSLSGWHTLSRQFPARKHPTDGVLRDCVVGIGPGPGLVRALNRSQTRVFGVLPSSAGLYLDAGSPARFRWPPLLIPWTDIQLVSTRALFGAESFELRLGRSVSYLTVTSSAFQLMAPFLAVANANP
jgi:hypothetical protein